MLRELKNYIKENKEVSVRDAAIRFESDESLIEALSADLVRKGLVKCFASGPCGGCSGCRCTKTGSSAVLKWKDSVVR